MSNSEEKLSKTDYNNIPVHYCKQCLSLKIIRVAGRDNVTFCDDCGCTDVEECNIQEWENLYKARYGFKLLNKDY